MERHLATQSFESCLARRRTDDCFSFRNRRLSAPDDAVNQSRVGNRATARGRRAADRTKLAGHLNSHGNVAKHIKAAPLHAAATSDLR